MQLGMIEPREGNQTESNSISFHPTELPKTSFIRIIDRLELGRLMREEDFVKGSDQLPHYPDKWGRSVGVGGLQMLPIEIRLQEFPAESGRGSGID